MESLNKTTDRLRQRFKRELGVGLLALLAQPDTLELVLNDDGQLWAQSLAKGTYRLNQQLDPHQSSSLLNLIAAMNNTFINEASPRLECAFPLIKGARFSATIPPMGEGASFNLRKPSPRVIPLEHYIDKEQLSLSQALFISEAIAQHKSIVVCGGPGTGKTTLCNSLLKEMVKDHRFNERIVILQDNPELICNGGNVLKLFPTCDQNYDDLLHHTLRRTPQRICMGEARGKEMLTLLKAWNTGTPGGLVTIHANSAQSAMQRIDDMVAESGLQTSRALVSEAVDLVIALHYNPVTQQRRVEAVLSLSGYDDSGYQFKQVA